MSQYLNPDHHNRPLALLLQREGSIKQKSLKMVQEDDQADHLRKGRVGISRTSVDVLRHRIENILCLH